MYLLPDPVAQEKQGCSSSVSPRPTCSEPKHVFPVSTCTHTQQVHRACIHTHTQHHRKQHSQKYKQDRWPPPLPSSQEWKLVSGNTDIPTASIPPVAGLTQSIQQLPLGSPLSPAAITHACPAPAVAANLPPLHTNTHLPTHPITGPSQ